MTAVLVIELHTQGTILVRSTSSPSYLTILYIQTPKQISKKSFLRTVSGFLWWLTCWMLKLSLSYMRKNNLYEFCCGLGIKVSRVLGISAFMATHSVTIYLYIFIKVIALGTIMTLLKASLLPAPTFIALSLHRN